MLIVKLETDLSAESPNNWGTWELISFAPDMLHYVHPETEVEAPYGRKMRLNEGLAAHKRLFSVHEVHELALTHDGNHSTYTLRKPGDKLAGVLLWRGEPCAVPVLERLKSADAFLTDYNQWNNCFIFQWTVEDFIGTVLGYCGQCWNTAYMFRELAEVIGGREFVIEGDAAWLARELPQALRNLIQAPELV